MSDDNKNMKLPVCENCNYSGNHGYWCYRHDRDTAPNGTCTSIIMGEE